MPFPKGRVEHLTGELLREMPISKYGSGQTIYDKDVPKLKVNKWDHHHGKVAMSISYGHYGLVVDGRWRKSEVIGLWPDMSLNDARQIAAERTKMWDEQKKNPVLAPPLREMKNANPRKLPKKLLAKIKAARPVEPPEAILDAPSNLPPEDRDRYESLMLVLMDAVSRASDGKGHERHDGGEMFEDQAMAKIMDRTSDHFALGQAIKKLTESCKLDWDRARNERLDAIVYIAGSIIWRDQGGGQ